MLLAAFVMKAQFWLHGKFVVHQDPGAFCCKAAFQLAIPQPVLAVSPQVQGFAILAKSQKEAFEDFIQ